MEKTKPVVCRDRKEERITLRRGKVQALRC